VTQGPWLVLDTATPTAVVGVVKDGTVLSEHTLAEAKKHAEGLIDAIDRALLAAGVGLDEIVGVGVGVGPGSFIGVRTGIATAKGIALGRRIPLVGLPTLVALAKSTLLVEGRGFAVVDAKRGEVYAQLVECSAGIVRALEPPQAMAPDALANLAGAFVVGNTAPANIELRAPSANGLAQCLDEKIAGGIVDEVVEVSPQYCRAPDAKLPAVDPSSRRPHA
jgi:tRNA threonylcarbamoyladenosine biosynthesis protein TsaB